MSSALPTPPNVPSSGTSLSDTSLTSSLPKPIASPVVSNPNPPVKSKPVRSIPAPSVHPMLTRLRAKSFVVSPPQTLVSSLEPSSVSEALLDSRWVKAMEDEYRALERNHT